MSDRPDYRRLAREAKERGDRAADPLLAAHYRRLAGAYLALARFHDRATGPALADPGHAPPSSPSHAPPSSPPSDSHRGH